MSRRVFCNILGTALALAGLTLGHAVAQAETVDLRDGGQWVTGGRRLSVTPPNQGQWTWSVTGPPDGSLRLRVEGPATGNSYGAVAWARTVANLNDGKSHVLDFDWQADVSDDHANLYFMQVTDGRIPTFEENNWTIGWVYSSEQEGTENLLWHSTGPQSYTADTPRQNWSIMVNPSGVARLYDGPNATGSLLGERMLDAGRPWHMRFMVFDGTSAGFPASEAELLLHRASLTSVPEPATLSMLGSVGALSLIAYAWRRRRRPA